ncbi:hypothetical protein ACFLYF_01540 [Chloroflexota bacterium]
MWRSKKFIIVAMLAIVVLAGSIGGVALAQTGNEYDGQPKTLLKRVADILVGKGISVTSEQLEEAFTQAKSEMKEAALDNRLQKLVDEGTINPDQATAYKEWLQAMPDMAPYKQQRKAWEQTKPKIPPEFKEWKQARPDMAPYKQELKDWQQTKPDIPSEVNEWKQAKPDGPF